MANPRLGMFWQDLLKVKWDYDHNSQSWFWGGLDGLNIPLVIPYADIVKLTLNLSSPPHVIQIWPKTDAQRHELVSH